MSLRRKTLLLISLILAGLIGVLGVSLSIILLRSYVQLEEKNARRNVQRVREALKEEINILNLSAQDWAGWDDMYNFIENNNSSFRKANLEYGSLSKLNINHFLLFNNQKKIVFSQGLDLENNQEISISSSFLQKLKANSILLNHSTPRNYIKGIIELKEAFLLVASQPIVTSENKGPIRGTLILGRYINNQKISELEQRTQLSLKFHRVNDPNLTPNLKSVVYRLQIAAKIYPQRKQASIMIKPLNEEKISGFSLVQDIYDKPALLIEVNLSRDIYQQGQTSLLYLVISLLVVGVVFSIVILLLLEKIILSRLFYLNQEVKHIGNSGDLSLRVATKGNDELTSLATTINRMLFQLESGAKELAVEREKTEELLLNILPEPIAVRLKHEENTIADNFAEVTVMFADIVGFTKLSCQIAPAELVRLLNDVFSRFDRLLEKYQLEKIKTIGDCYMVVGGLPVKRSDHAETIAEMALDMQVEINKFNQENNQQLQMRIGINTGSVVAGVIGLKKFIYDLWGDAVNTASRMESHGIPEKIHVSASTYERLKDKYQFEKRGVIDVKGKGKMTTYFLKDRKVMS